MSVADRIKARRLQLRMSQEELAEKLGYKSKSSINKIELGRQNLTQTKIKAIADALETSPSYIMGWIDEDGAEKGSSIERSHSVSGLTPYHPTKRIPILGRVAAGLPLLAEENIEGYTSVDFDDDESYYALRVHGDSMSAVGINDGDLVVVRQQTTVDEGQIAVVLVNGNDATIKYFKQQGNMVFLTPKSYNPEHQIQVYNLDETPVRIIGRVVSSQRYY